jgi:hypothetical protein
VRLTTKIEEIEEDYEIWICNRRGKGKWRRKKTIMKDTKMENKDKGNGFLKKNKIFND